MIGEGRAQKLFTVLAAFFVVSALLAGFIGVKIFALEDILGLRPFEWNLFGQTGSLTFTAGTLLLPIVFIMTDTINEHYGQRGLRFISWLAVALIFYGFLFAVAAIHLAPASWWVGSAQLQGVPDQQAALAAILGQGLWTIAGSVIAFLIGQLIDSFVVLYTAFVIGPQHWPLDLFFAVGTLNYLYKLGAALALIPLLYLARAVIHWYLGHGQAQGMMDAAARD